MNQISDIKVLEKIKFENLEELNLYANQINQKDYSSLINKLQYIKFYKF